MPFWVYILVALIVIICIGGGAMLTAANQAAMKELETRGITTEARLLSKQAEEHEDINPDGRGTNRTKRYTTYLLTYTYGVNGELYERGEMVDRQRYERAQKGETVKLRYLPDKPDVSRVMFDS